MVLRFLPPVVVFNGHALDIANAYILLQSITRSAENEYFVGNTDQEKGQCVEEGVYGRKYGKATINEILWQPVTMYIHIYIYIYMCSK